MNAFLLFNDRVIEDSFTDDRLKDHLELARRIESMALEEGMGRPDPYIKETVSMVFSSGNLCRTKEDILYRQEILTDCIHNPEKIRRLYSLISRCIEANRDTYLSITHKKAKFMLDVSVKTLLAMEKILKEVFRCAREMLPLCHSEGLSRLLNDILLLFDPVHLDRMRSFAEDMSTKNGITSAATLGKYFKADGFHSCRNQKVEKKGLLRFLSREKNCVEFDIDMNDPDVSPALSALRDDMVISSASVLVRSKNELYEYFNELKRELSFYIGCLNLKNELEKLGISVSMPKVCGKKPVPEKVLPADSGGTAFVSFKNLYNVSLSLQEKRASVSNTIDCPGEKIIVITGSNQGGKTTFLRSLGQALLMMNSGMYTASAAFEACPGEVFSHFIREEDESLKSGKLDEELLRMNNIVDHITPGSWLLLNESFASTNEEEGSEIAMEIISALHDHGIHIVYVTHFYHLTRLLMEADPEGVLYLNAPRDESGGRSFRLEPGEPVVRGYGEDLYDEIFNIKGVTL